MNDFYILLAQFFSTCLLQYFYICLGKIKQIKNSNTYENIDLGSLQVWSGCLYIQFGVRNESLLPCKNSFKVDFQEKSGQVNFGKIRFKP